uniref:Putative mRNA capping-enzyme n=1 Tax=Pichia etchellsii TaxID=28550 RepID=Q9HFH9_PICET|nr:putative mRNA capping-enzyme [Schwanniomyces etchellsii]
MSFKNIAKLANKLESNLVDIELEVRFKIPPPLYFKADVNKTITYYNSNIYNSITFRSYDSININTKELIKSEKINGIMVYLSVEQNYVKNDLKIPLLITNKRKISRMIINDDPLTEIIKCDNEYTMEIEFDITNYYKVNDIIHKYKCYYYPIQKPMEISSNNLARKLIKIDNWSIAPKADGIHVLVIENNKSRILLFDNGTIRSINNKTNRKMIEPVNIFEAELIDNKLLYYDCLMYNKENILYKNYKERRKYIKKNKKEAYIFKSFDDLKNIFDYKFKYKIDGFVITNIYNRNKIYKSKFINTVDLRYNKGFLYLENETESTRIPKNNTNLENDKIYEFDMNLNVIKERPDKNIANYKFPYDDNPLYNIVTGYGVPSLRVYHNKIKFELLKLLKNKNLLDIGSGKGGDINKWINLKFEKVYAVDPNLDLRSRNKNIIGINKNVKDLPNFIKYDCVSILFVPWNDEFIKIISKVKEAIIIIMNKPINYECENYKCSVKNNKIFLDIKNTETGEEIIEYQCDISLLKNKLKKYSIKEIDNYMEFGTESEIILSRMYSYYYIKEKDE